jgi:glycosyltransferase involved in cell wall biosynthesis
MTLSAVVIGGDQAWMVRPCLERLSFADEILFVVDSRSEDETERVAREITDKVFVRELESFSAQRNYAIEKAQGDWILFVDLDERVTPSLARQIRQAIAAPGSFVGFQIALAHFGFGKQLRHGGWRENVPRLTRRDSVRYHGSVDELPEVAGPIGMLSGELWHFSHRDAASMLEKIASRAPLRAQQLLDSGAPPVTDRTLLAACARAFYTKLIKQRGFQDGTEGVIQSLYHAFGIFIDYEILWEMQRRPALEQTYEQLETRASEEHPPRIRGRFIE